MLPDLAARATPLLAARVRPAQQARGGAASSSAITSKDESHVAVHAAGREFPVDIQLWGSDQEQAWSALGMPLVNAVLSGVSATLLTHGCASAGKSYTVCGHGIDAPGLAPRCLRALCEAASERASGLQLELCMLEVYMDRAHDLLAPRSPDQPRLPLQMDSPRNGTTVWWSPAPAASSASAPSRGSARGGASLLGGVPPPPGDCWYAVDTIAQAEALYELGEAQRTTRPTALHPRTSRGHSLLFVRLTKLKGGAGSEEEGDARATGGADYSGEDDFEEGVSSDGDGAVVAEVEWQCRLCLATLCGSERVEANGSLSATALRESLSLSASLSALSGLLPQLIRREANNKAAAAESSESGEAVAVPSASGPQLTWGTPLVQLLRETLEGHAALVVLACLSPSESLAAESLSTLRALAAIRSLPLHPTSRVSAVRMAMVSAAARVGSLKASAAIGDDGHDTGIGVGAPPGAQDRVLREATAELITLRALLSYELREWPAKVRHAALCVRKAAMVVRHAGMPTAYLLESFGWSADLSELRWHDDETDEHVAEAGGFAPPMTASAQEYLHTAHLLDLPAAALGGPTLRLPLPLPGQRTWVRGVSPSAAGPLSAPSAAPSAAMSATAVDGRMFADGDERHGDGALRIFGQGVGDPHALLAVSSDGAVQIEVVRDDATCVLNGDLLTPGHAFILHHGDRLFIGTERLFLVSLWRPLHDGSHEAAAAAAAAAGNGSVVIGSDAAPVGGWTASPTATDVAVGGTRGRKGRGGFGGVGGGGHGGGGALAFRLEAESLMKRAEHELVDSTGIRFHELHRLRRAGQVLRSTWRRAAQSLFTPAEVHSAELAADQSGAASPPLGLARMDTAHAVAAAVRATDRPLEPLGGPLWRGQSAAATSPVGEDGGEAVSARSPPDAQHPRLTPMTRLLASASGNEMIDSACSARPYEDAVLSEVPALHNQLAQRDEEHEALATEMAMLRVEASEVAEENRVVREALDESRLRLSVMAEELAATRAALRAREVLDGPDRQVDHTPPPVEGGGSRDAAALRVPQPKSKHAGGGNGLLDWVVGCAGGREPPPRAYAVTLHPALPAPKLPLSPPKEVPVDVSPAMVAMAPSPPPRRQRPPQPPAPRAVAHAPLEQALGSERRPAAVALPPSPGTTPPHHNWYSPSAWAAPPPEAGAPVFGGDDKKRLRAERRAKSPTRPHHRQSHKGKRGQQATGSITRSRLEPPARGASPRAAPAGAAREHPDGKAWMCGGYDAD